MKALSALLALLATTLAPIAEVRPRIRELGVSPGVLPTGKWNAITDVAYTVGALVQSNFGGILTIDGVRVGEKLGGYDFRGEVEAGRKPPELGSCMIVLATDAPLSSRNLERLARRAVLGLGRAGSSMANGSGDFVIAFSTRNLEQHAPAVRTRTVEEVQNDFVSPLFLAAVEAVEEAIYNSLTKATTVTGNGKTVEAIPIDRLRSILAERKK